MLKISAQVQSGDGSHRVTLQTNDRVHAIDIPPKLDGTGSSANGGELLFLALATCYCNDIYREAARRGIVVGRVSVDVQGEFDPVPGSPAANVTYSATVEAEASEVEVRELMQHTDTVAEIQNTLRQVTPIALKAVTAISL